MNNRKRPSETLEEWHQQLKSDKPLPIRATPEGRAVMGLLSHRDLADIKEFKRDIEKLCAGRFGMVEERY